MKFIHKTTDSKSGESSLFSSNSKSLHLFVHLLMFPCLRGLGLTIAVVLLLAFIERPSSLSASSDPRYRSPSWEPPCGLTEGIEMVCLVVFSLDLAVKVHTRLEKEA